MASNRKIMVLPGDGIGTEIMAANMKIIDWLAKHRSIDFDMEEGLVGGAAYDAHGTPLTDETLADSIASDSAGGADNSNSISHLYPRFPPGLMLPGGSVSHCRWC